MTHGIAENLEDRIVFATVRGSASLAMALFTTSASFFIVAVSSLLPIKSFGVFAGVLIMVLYWQIVLIIPPVLVIYSRHFEDMPMMGLLWPARARREYRERREERRRRYGGKADAEAAIAIADTEARERSWTGGPALLALDPCLPSRTPPDTPSLVGSLGQNTPQEPFPCPPCTRRTSLRSTPLLSPHRWTPRTCGCWRGSSTGPCTGEWARPVMERPSPRRCCSAP